MPSSTDPYGGDQASFTALGVSVTYNPSNEKWSIDFGNTASSQLFSDGEHTFYVVVHDQAGNTWGSMYSSTYTPDSPDSYGDYLGPKNTFSFTEIN